MEKIQVYSDQNGYQLYPDNITQHDDTILKYFNNNIKLFISKNQNKLEIICHILAHKGVERDQGYYIKYKTHFSGKSFKEFKYEAEDILKHLEFSFHSGSNKLYKNVEKFDSYSGFGISNLDINTILYAVEKYNKLEFEGNNIDEISGFCLDILENSPNVTISISPESNTIGNINILLNEKKEQLNPTGNTKQIIEKYNNYLQKQKKSIIEQKAKKKIKYSIDELKNAGFENNKIKSILDSLIEETSFLDYSEQSMNNIKKKRKVETNDKTNRPPTFEIDKSWVIIIIIFGLLIIFLSVFLLIDLNPDLDINNIFNHSSESSPLTDTPIPENSSPGEKLKENNSEIILEKLETGNISIIQRIIGNVSIRDWINKLLKK